MLIEETRIAAHVCGDGWLISYIEKNSLQIVHGRKYHRDRKRFEIGYCNTEKILLKQFENDMRKIFNLKARKPKFELRFRSKRVFERIRELGGGNSKSWFISEKIKNSKKLIKKEWLKAFFDDEAGVDPVSKRIRIKSMNFKGLLQVKGLLKDLKIESRITGPNVDNSWYLTLSGNNVALFYKKIGFNHQQKKNKLKRINFSR